MYRKIWLAVLAAVWTCCSVMVRECYDWAAFGLYVLGSVIFSAYILVLVKKDD